MPLHVMVQSLIDLSINTMVEILKDMIIIENRVTEAVDDLLLEAEYNRSRKREAVSSLIDKASLEEEEEMEAMQMMALKEALQQQGDFYEIIVEYLEHVPQVYLNQIFDRLIVDLANIYFDDHEILNFMKDQWSSLQRIKFRFHLIIKSILTSKIYTINISPIMNNICKVFSSYLITSHMIEDHEFVNEMETKRKDLFLPALEKYRHDMCSLTTLKLQNFAHGPLIWLISANCPSLWHLDISGQCFDLKRYCFQYKMQDSPVVNEKRKQNFDKAEFLKALCSLYGNDGRSHEVYGKVKGCLKLKTLYLPWVKWEKEEEIQLLCETYKILLHLQELEEFSGANIMDTLMRMNQSAFPPIMLKLKKFSNNYGGHLIKAEPDQLRNVHLPLVTEVEFIVSSFTPLATLEIFPNLRNLSLSPFKFDSYTYLDVMKYLTGLQKLNIQVTHELSVEDIHNLAKQCPHLESLTLTCPALRIVAQELSKEHMEENIVERDEATSGIYLRKLHRHSLLPKKSKDLPVKVSDYIEKLANMVSPTYSDDNKDFFVPNLHSLHSFHFYGMQSVDHLALLRCIRGCPNLRTLVIGAKYKGLPLNVDDDLIGKMASMLKYLREFVLACDSDHGKYTFEKVTNMSILHIINFCREIRSIGTVVNWNIKPDDISGWAYEFDSNNYEMVVY